MKNKLNFLEAESVALNQAYKQFYGDTQPIGIAFTFIKDKKNGNEWSNEEKEIAKYISRTTINELTIKNLTNLITTGVVRDCNMARRFMSTGSGQTKLGYNF